MNESVLIGRAENFLDQIKKNKIEAHKIQDHKEFLELYTYLRGNLDNLQQMRDTMEMKGYTTPYRSIIKYGRRYTGEMKTEDIYDISRHTHYFRMNAAAKKNILDRVKSSIASHRIALGHLDDYAILKCPSCQQKYKGHEIALLNGGKCKCGENDLKLAVSRKGVYRLEIIQFLPISGDYMVKMSELIPQSREAFRSIVRILKQEKRGAVKTLSLVIKVLEEGRWMRKRVNVPAQEQANYEREIRDKYGSNARIEFLQFHRKKPSIINNKHVQNALSLGYVKHAENQIMKILSQVLEKVLLDARKVESYLEALEIAGNKSKMFDEVNDAKNLEKKFLKEELESRDLLDDNGDLDKDVLQDIMQREELQKSLFREVPRILILWDLLHYYLSTSYDRRSKHSGPFPYLRPSLDSNQIKAFQDFKPNVVQILQEYLQEKIEYVPEMGKMLFLKFAAEKKLKGLHLQIGPALGAVILSNEAGLSLEKVSELFSVSEENVQREKAKLETLQKPTTSKAQRFLEIVKE
jgi:uncharacterized protein